MKRGPKSRPLAELGRLFGVTKQAVQSIVSYKNWRHVA